MIGSYIKGNALTPTSFLKNIFSFSVLFCNLQQINCHEMWGNTFNKKTKFGCKEKKTGKGLAVM